MSQIPSDHVYTEFKPKTRTTYNPDIEQTVSGTYQDAGAVPGFWTGTWRAQVGSNIDTGFFGGTVAAITSPAQFIQAKSAKNTIFNGVINIADREVSKGPKYSETLGAIQYDESKTGKDWWEALPEKVRQDAADMGITPTNYDYDAQTFAEDFKETYAWSTYMRDASRTAANHSGFTNFAGNLLLGAATDPTSLLSFGIGRVGGTAGKLLGSVGKATKLDTFAGNLAFQTALGSIQNVDAMIHRDFQSERLGIQPGDITASDYITGTIEGAAINALTATGLHGVGYFSRMAMRGVSQKLSADALEFAKGTKANLAKDVMNPDEFATLFNKIKDGKALKPTEQVPILREVLSQYGLNLHDDSFYDFGSFEAIGMHPIDVAAKILHEGMSPHQVTTLFNNAAMVADDLAKVSPGPMPRTKLQEAIAYVPTEPVVNVEKKLPKYVTDAGYQFDAVGNLVKTSIPAQATPSIPVYHGTSADVSTLDPSKSGGLVYFSTDKNAATNYANGAGGNRISTGVYAVDETGYVYEQTAKSDSWKAIGMLGNDGITVNKIATLVVPEITTDRINESLKRNDGTYYTVSKTAKVLTRDISGKKILDLNSTDGISILASLDPSGNTRTKSIIESAKKGEKFDWSHTKQAKQTKAMEPIVSQLKKLGYDGIKFRDDMHDTYGMFEDPVPAAAPTSTAIVTATPVPPRGTFKEQALAFLDAQQKNADSAPTFDAMVGQQMDTSEFRHSLEQALSILDNEPASLESFRQLKLRAAENPKGWQATEVGRVQSILDAAKRWETESQTPVSKPIAEAPPARQGLAEEVIDPLNPPKAKAGQSEDPIASALMSSKDKQDFAVKLGDMLAEGKLVMTKDIKSRIQTIIGAYDMAKDLALKTSAEVKGPKVTETDLKARAVKVTGRSDTLVPMDKGGKRQVEIPNLRDRLVWMASKGFPEVRGEAEKILNDFYGLGIREIRNLRTAIKESMAAAGKAGRGVDRLKVTRNPDGTYTTEVIRTVGGPKERSIADAVRALTPEAAAKADEYAKKHNLNVQDKINKTKAKIVAKGDGVVEPVFEGPKAIKPKDAKDYSMAVKQGKYAEAYAILNANTLGENNASKIAELYVKSKNARLALETAVRTGVSKDINAAKADLDKIHAEFNKIKIAMFASSDAQLGRVTLGTKMLGGQSRLLRTLAGTPIEPAHQFYVEPVGPLNGREGLMSDALLRLDRAFAKMSAENLASRVSTDVPDGMFAAAADTILKLDGTFFLKSEAGRALTDKTPMVSLLVDLVDTYRLQASNILGKNEMSPSLGTMYRMMNTETRAAVKAVIDGAKKLGVEAESEAFHQSMYDAMVERTTGTKRSSGVNRPLVDLIIKEVGGYFDKGASEGILTGKIRQHDPNYFRVILNHLARRDLEGVSNAFFESHVGYFMNEDSPIHEGTLQKVHPIEILKADGTPIETLKDLKDVNPQAANDYLKMLSYDSKDAPLRNMSDKAIRVRMGIEVADDVDINREVSYYMNSGLGKHLDSSLLVNANMRKYIETNPFNILSEYSRNVRYYAVRQDVVNKFIQNLTSQDVKGITFDDLLSYSERRLQDIYGDKHHADIKKLFTALRNKEAQITGRLMGKNAGNAGLDGLMTIAVAPVQATVTGGISFTSNVMDASKAFVGNMYKGILGPEGGAGMFRNFAKLIRGMHKRDILAGQHAMMGALEHASLYDVDHTRMSYAGGPLATKVNLVRKAFSDFGTGVSGLGDSSIPIGSRFKNFAQGVSAVFNEPVRQLFMIDNITAVTADAYHARARWEFSAYIEQILKDPDFFSKDRKATEIISRMEAVGLFSEDARRGLRAIDKYSPDFFSKDWTVSELNELMLKMKADVRVDNDAFKAVQNTYNALWKACDDYVDSRIMTLPRVWDMADTGQPHALNRFLNTFTGYSRWFFSRQMLQRFPTSSSYKVAMLGAWYVMAEAVSMLMRDAMLDWNKFTQMTDDIDDDLAETYLSQALMRVPTMGQLTNSAFGGARQAWNLFAPKEYQTSTERYRGGTLYSGYVWNAGFQEISKAAKGETYDMNKIRKLIPYMNAPIVGGFMQEDK